ncbi:M48 family metallopeptidase [Hansschlegelia sp. KR7-227]|uniref:M48 family metallopeptidase n=1 Tax=Hansschlegelia sp. KR7-227 TaxID=3400914 RepID=UPI003BFAC14E
MSLFRAFRSKPQTARPTPRRGDGALLLETRLGDVPITVRRSSQARRMTLRVRAATRDVTLTLPPHASIAGARDFVERHVPWIEQRLARLPDRVPFAPGEIIPIRGVAHRVSLRENARGVVRIEPGLRGEPPALAVHGLPAHAARRIADFLKREARADLQVSVARHAATLGVTVGRLTLKDTKSRWGSCSASGDLAFSWRLILAPAFVLDYLAAHEVAHRREMNHGARYWAHVARLTPDYERAESWLKAHGAALHRYG